MALYQNYLLLNKMNQDIIQPNNIIIKTRYNGHEEPPTEGTVVKDETILVDEITDDIIKRAMENNGITTIKYNRDPRRTLMRIGNCGWALY